MISDTVPCDAPVCYDYYYEVTKVKKYERNMVGSVVLGSIVVIGTLLFIFRFYGVLLFQKCDWAILDKYFIPPFHFVHYGMMIFVDPSEHIETLCLFGRIMLPIIAVLYSIYMSWQSFEHSSPLELIFYVSLVLVPLSTILPETVFGVKYLRPFLRRPEEEIEAERLEIIKKFQLPKQNE